MTNSLIHLIIILLIILIVVAIAFAVLDRLLKGGSSKKSTEKPSAPQKPAPNKPVEKPVPEPKAVPTMEIYNSELADDLNAMLKDSNNTTPARLQIENHMNKESNIAKYIQTKNYHGFDFGTDDVATAEETNEPMTFTREDYKRFMALSNIDDKKPL